MLCLSINLVAGLVVYDSKQLIDSYFVGAHPIFSVSFLSISKYS